MEAKRTCTRGAWCLSGVPSLDRFRHFRTEWASLQGAPLLRSSGSGRRVRLQLHTALLSFVPHLRLYFHAESRPRLSVVSSPTRTSPAFSTTGLEVPCSAPPGVPTDPDSRRPPVGARTRPVRWPIVVFDCLALEPPASEAGRPTVVRRRYVKCECAT